MDTSSEPFQFITHHTIWLPYTVQDADSDMKETTKKWWC